VGQVLSDEEIDRLKERDNVEKAVGYGMNLLSYRPRSEAEIRRRMRRKDYEAHAIDEAVERLKRVDLVDDRAFARYWVDNRFRFKPRGRAILRKELWQKGINDQIIDETLEDYDEQDAIDRAAEKGIRRLRRYDSAAFRRKLTGYLRRRGFPYHLINPIVEQAMAEQTLEDSLERENEG
jgi:regulatory protein